MIRSFYLSFSLPSRHNRADFIKLLYLIYSTYFSAVHNNRSFLVNYSVYHSPIRTSRGGDYLLYDPYNICLVDSDAAHLDSCVVCPHTHWFPTGFIFVESESDDKTIAEAKIGSVPVLARYVLTVSVVYYTFSSDVLSASS